MKTHYKEFHFPDETHSWYIKYKSHFPSDNDNDKEFLQAINYYTASANPLFNNLLRYNAKLESDDFIYPYIIKMIDKLPTYQIPDNIVVYRYISKGLLKEMCLSYPPKKGMIITDNGFMSTTLIRESVNSYRDGRNQHILLVIYVPSGTKGTYVGHLKDTLTEYEVILAPNTKLHIDNKFPFLNCYFECTVVN